MNLSFANIWWIWAGVLAGAALLIAVRLRGRVITGDALRAALVAVFIGAALANPELSRRETEASSQLTALIDLSQSIGNAEDTKRLIRQLPAGSRCIGFSEQAVAAPCDQLVVTGEMKSVNKTSLANALALTRGSLVLFSDGRENLGSAEVLVSSDPSRFTLYPVISSTESETPRLAQITYPPFITAQQQFSIGVAVSGVKAQGSEGLSLSIKRSSDPSVVKKERVNADLSGAKSRTLFEFTTADKYRGLEEFTVVLSDASGKELDSRVVLVGTNSEKEILLVSNQESIAQPFAETLRQQGFTVIVSRDGADVELSKLRAVIFVNTARSELASGFEERLAKFVRAGGTFIMTGGPKSFASGGYKSSLTADLLPVTLLPPETVQKRLSIAIALVLDKSQSMSQGDRLEGSKGAALEVIRSLKDDDTIAVLGFDDNPFVVIRASPVGQIRDQAAERIERLYADGGTNLVPALDQARRILSKVDAGRKHMIVMTDGRLPDESNIYFELLRQMRLVGITASTVLLGGDIDFSFLKQMAEIGGGGFYQTSDPRLLPRIFLQDIKVSVNAPTPPGVFGVKEVKPQSVRLREYPDVTAVSALSVKTDAVMELSAVQAGEQAQSGKPLLASWSVGSGRALAFSADMVGQQTAAWYRWGKLGEFWRQVILQEGQSSASDDATTKEASVEFTVEQRGEYAALNLTIYNAPARAAVDLRVSNPDGTDVSFKKVQETSPGRYRAIVKTATAGPYTVRIADWLPPVGFAVREQDFADIQNDTVDTSYLHRLAAMTGGQVLNAGDLSSLNNISVMSSARIERIDLTWLAILLGLLTQIIGMLVRRG